MKNLLRKTLLPATVIVLLGATPAIIAGCGSSDSSESATPKTPFTLSGTYVKSAGASAAPYASITFLAEQKFFAYREGCAAGDPGCRVTGHFALNADTGNLALTLDGGGVQNIAVTAHVPPKAATNGGTLVTADDPHVFLEAGVDDSGRSGGAIGPDNGGSGTSDDGNSLVQGKGSIVGEGTALTVTVAATALLDGATYARLVDPAGSELLFCASPTTAEEDCSAQSASFDDAALADGDLETSSLRVKDAKSTCSCAKNRTYTLQMTAKAYIASLGLDVGSPGLPFRPFLFGGLAAATAAYYHEAPTELGSCEGAPPATFDTCRLKATATLRVTCAGTKVVAFESSQVDESGGDEGPLHGFVAKAFAKTQINKIASSTVGDAWLLVYGHPPSDIEPSFQAVKERPNVDIWNHAHAAVRCTANGVAVIATLEGSKFPSQAVWVSRVDGGRSDVLGYHNRTQGYFGDLWNLEPVPNGP